MIGLITLFVNCAGARSAGNLHAACEVAGAGNGATDDSTRARRRKLRIQTRVFLVGYRASVRPYHYLAALEIMPSHVHALFNLARALEERKRFDDAIAAYKKALRIDPDFADVHYHLAQLYEQGGHRQSALRHIARYQSLVEATTMI